MPKRIYDPAVIRDLLAERARHSWSLGELSRRSGVPVGTLSTWAARERRSLQPLPPPTAAFTEAIPIDPPQATGTPSIATVLLRHSSGWTAELRGEAATVAAAKLVEALTRCS
jgi:hypothetical protein